MGKYKIIGSVIYKSDKNKLTRLFNLSNQQKLYFIMSVLEDIDKDAATRQMLIINKYKKGIDRIISKICENCICCEDAELVEKDLVINELYKLRKDMDDEKQVLKQEDCDKK